MQAQIAPAPDDPQPLSEEEAAEKDKLLQEGFSNWNRRDFNAFVRACEKVHPRSAFPLYSPWPRLSPPYQLAHRVWGKCRKSIGTCPQVCNEHSFSCTNLRPAVACSGLASEPSCTG